MKKFIDSCSLFITFTATSMAAFIMYVLINMPVTQVTF